MTLFPSFFVHWPRPERRCLTAIVAGTALVAAALVGTGGTTAQGAVALPFECDQVNATVTCTYQQVGVQRVFPVPAGVKALKVTAVGGRGGRAGASGGSGALVTGTLTVQPGSSLYVTVGGAASAGLNCLSGFIQCVGGANGGGAGHAGGGGGGSSDIRTSALSLASRVVVAAGGGGGGADAEQSTAQGGGGGNAGRPGADGTGLGAGTGGEAGTPNIGGDGGIANGQDGRVLEGGDSTGANDSAGAGGGGLFGGGSGGVGSKKGATASGGGGGGSSRAPIGFTVSVSQATQGSVVLVYAVPDTEPPSISFGTPAPAEATGPQGAPVTYQVSATDAVDGPVAVTCTPGSGSAFPVGITTVACTATDSAGNVGTGGGTVTVSDTTPPALAVPSSVTVASDIPTAVTYEVTATDLVDQSVTPTCTPASGSTFSIGRTTVTCTATDQRGNSVTRTFVVLVDDGMPPVLQLPAAVVSVEAQRPEGADVQYTASASDAVDGAVPVTCSPPSGSLFPLGDTTVVCTASDSEGRPAAGSFVVRVQDSTGPQLTVPDDISVEAAGPDGTAVTFETSATDTVSGVGPVTCSPASGATFAVGTTTVTCTASDSAGNTGSATFDVKVIDTTKPVVTPTPPTPKEATGPTGAAVTFTATASDTVSGTLPTSCTPASGSTFAVGTTTVTCTATDAAGNTGTATFDVKVLDTTGPVVSVPAPITVPATSAAGAAVTYTATASDVVDGSRPVTCTKASGTVFPVGTTTVTCTATDTRGNTATGTFTVTVQPYQANLTVTVTGPTSVTRGGSATYTVTVTNVGPSTATNVRTVLAASGLSVTATNPTTGSGSVKIQGVTYSGALWTTASIPKDGSVTFTLTGTVTAKKGDTVIAQGATTSDVPDPATANNVARATSTVPR